MQSQFTRRSITVALTGLVACGALTLNACGESTASSNTFQVTVTMAKVGNPNFDVSIERVPAIACDIDLRAIAKGHGTGTWLDATMRWYALHDLSTPFDTHQLDSAAVRRHWGKSK